jgi:hypothetical protein
MRGSALRAGTSCRPSWSMLSRGGSERAGGKSVQGYNGQVVASPEQVIIAAEVTQSHNDADELEPMVAHAIETLREAGIEEPIGIVPADGGYWNSPAISEVRRQGIDLLVPTQDRRRRTPRKLSARQGHEAQRIEAALSTPEGQMYRRRQQIVEPVFAHTKVIRRSDRFLRRGLSACQAEWKLIAATHNLLKLWRASLAHAATSIAEPAAARRPPAATAPPGPQTNATALGRRTSNRKPPLRGFVQQPQRRGFRCR